MAFTAEADPSPFGLILNKTTIAELKAKYRASSIGINKNNGMEAFDIAPEDIHLEGLISARVAFSKDGILKLFQMSLAASQFDAIVAELNKKYTILYKNAVPGSNREAKFENDNTYVLLYAPREAPEMDFLYINKKMLDDTLKTAVPTPAPETASKEALPPLERKTDVLSQL